MECAREDFFGRLAAGAGVGVDFERFDFEGGIENLRQKTRVLRVGKCRHIGGCSHIIGDGLERRPLRFVEYSTTNSKPRI